MPIEMSEPLQSALDAGGLPLRVVDPRSRAEYVLISAAVYERLHLLGQDTIFTSAEMLDRVMCEDDANDPMLEEYQRLYGDSAK